MSFECKTPIHKILRKENVELHYEKEQLKLERDRLRHTLKEKLDQLDKMSSSMGDMEEQLFQAKRALEDRVNTSSRLEDRLVRLDTELNRYRERFAKLEKQNKKLADQIKSSKGSGLEKTNIEGTSENQKVLCQTCCDLCEKARFHSAIFSCDFRVPLTHRKDISWDYDSLEVLQNNYRFVYGNKINISTRKFI